jgi:hypothetical protein
MRQLLVVREYLDVEASSNAPRSRRLKATPPEHNLTPGPPLPLQCLLYGTLYRGCQGA